MQKIVDLDFGFSDAENYKRRENKETFNRMFLQTEDFDRILQPNTYFVIGEKGTGKTAYAVYLANNDHQNTRSTLKFLRETDYQKFVALKNERHLQLSDYTNIWKVIIYVLFSKQIVDREPDSITTIYSDPMKRLKKAIDSYYHSAFAPEILNAIQFAEDCSTSAKVVHEAMEAGVEKKSTKAFTEQKFQTNLMYLQQQLEIGLSSAKLKKDHLLFIDGIDIRPGSINFTDYLDCIKGLANAIWALNNDIFSEIKGSKGRLRVLLLVRPDIFVHLGLQNQNTKIRDNAVFLNWRCSFKDHRESKIFTLIDGNLRKQQLENCASGESWDYYFSYNSPIYSLADGRPSSFIDFWVNSFFRPRDIITGLHLIKERTVQRRGKTTLKFISSDFSDSEFQKRYSRYLLGEIKDQFLFFNTEEEYKVFLKFFKELKGASGFTWKEFDRAFTRFYGIWIKHMGAIPEFLETSERFLQFLYELNVVCYVEKKHDFKNHYHWSYIDRNHANPTPAIAVGKEYRLFRALGKALDIGKRDAD